jgi:hypothetical protein
MNSLRVLAAATDQGHMNSCCAELILAAETECGAFIFATKQLFGEAMALRVGYLWVETLEAASSFRCQHSGLRLVTILATGKLADLMRATCQMPTWHQEPHQSIRRLRHGMNVRSYVIARSNPPGTSP